MRAGRPAAVALGALLVIGVVDLLLRVGGDDLPMLVVGLLDWPAHLATTLVVLLALPRRLPEDVLLGAVVGSVAIDLDHAALLLGSDAFDGPLVRPYTHALWTLALLAAVALALRRVRPRATAAALTAGATLGLASHFARDLATGPGLNVLWPASEAVVRAPWALYAALVAAAALVVVARTVRA